MEYRIIRNDELYHHGVKGMKWGVRKAYEPVGRRRRSMDSYSDEERKAKTRKAIVAGAAVAATALAAYGAYKYYGKRPSEMLTYGVDEPLSKMLGRYPSKDITIGSKTTMQRVSADSFLDLKSKGYTYVSYKFRDKQGYLSGFRKEMNRNSAKDFVHKLTPKQDLKMASPGSVAKEFLKLHPEANDQTFRLVTSPYSTNHKSITAMRKELFDSLKRQGYSGFVDIEDAAKRRNSAPIILFDPDKYVTVSKSRKIGKMETFVADVLK